MFQRIGKMTLIDETIQYGSVQLALKEKAFTVNHIITRLTEIPSTQRTLLAYRQACLLGNDTDQYVNDRHFLSITLGEEYAAIFVLSGRHQKDDDTEVLAPLASGLRRLAVDPIFSRTIRLICDDLNVSNIGDGDIPVLIQAYSTSLLSLVLRSPENFRTPTIDDYLSGDYLEEPIPHGEAKKVLERCTLLAAKANSYWRTVAMPAYTRYLERSMEEHGLEGLSPDSFRELRLLIPKLFEDLDLAEISDIGFRLLTLPTILAGYYLGLPIHHEEPSRKKIVELIKELSHLGVEEYTNRLEAAQRAELKQHISHEHDVLYENIFRYGPFDRVQIQQKGHTFIFTRPEFPNLISSKTNHWNHTPLPVPFIEKLRYRQKVAFTLRLPNPMPVDQLLHNVLVERKRPPPRDRVTPMLPSHFINPNWLHRLIGNGEIE